MFAKTAAFLAILQLIGAQNGYNEITKRLDLLDTSNKNLHLKIDMLNLSVDQQFNFYQNEIRKIFGLLFDTVNVKQRLPFEDDLSFELKVDITGAIHKSKPKPAIEANQGTQFIDNLIQSIKANQFLGQPAQYHPNIMETSKPIEYGSNVAATQPAKPFESGMLSSIYGGLLQNTQPSGILSPYQQNQPFKPFEFNTATSQLPKQYVNSALSMIFADHLQQTKPIGVSNQSIQPNFGEKISNVPLTENKEAKNPATNYIENIIQQLNQNKMISSQPMDVHAITTQSPKQYDNAALSMIFGDFFQQTEPSVIPNQRTQVKTEANQSIELNESQTQSMKPSKSRTETNQPSESLTQTAQIKLGQLQNELQATTESTQLKQPTTTQSITLNESTTQSTPPSKSITQSNRMNAPQPTISVDQAELSKLLGDSKPFSEDKVQSTTSKQELQRTTQSTKTSAENAPAGKIQSIVASSKAEIKSQSTLPQVQRVESTKVQSSEPKPTQSTANEITGPAVIPTAALSPQANCSEALKQSGQTKGIFKIQVPKSELPPFDANCFADTNDEKAKDSGIIAGIDNAWMIVQRRQDGSVNFNRTWQEYKDGFGDLEGEFFLGLDKLNALTQSTVHELWVQLEDFKGIKRWAKYNTFKIANAENGYALDIGNYVGNAGNSLFGHFGAKFSTYDMDNDKSPNEHCARLYGAWWHKNCFEGNLNGPYTNGVIWKHFRGYKMSLKYVHMAIRPIKYELDSVGTRR